MTQVMQRQRYAPDPGLDWYDDVPPDPTYVDPVRVSRALRGDEVERDAMTRPEWVEAVRIGMQDNGWTVNRTAAELGTYFRKVWRIARRHGFLPTTSV